MRAIERIEKLEKELEGRTRTLYDLIETVLFPLMGELHRTDALPVLIRDEFYSRLRTISSEMDEEMERFPGND